MHVGVNCVVAVLPVSVECGVGNAIIKESGHFLLFTVYRRNLTPSSI